MKSGEPRPANGAAPEPVPLRAVLADAARALLTDLRRIALARWHLLALEVREAACNLLAMAALLAAVGVLLALAWVGLTAACALWLVEQGVRTSLAVLASSGLNLLAAACALLALRRRNALQSRLASDLRKSPVKAAFGVTLLLLTWHRIRYRRRD
jgi:hypothetical protein